MDSLQKQMYFEQQSIFSNNCAIYTVNNLIGYPAFSASTFNQICSILQTQAKANGFSVKTKHILSGDYDVNVIQKALLNCGFQTTWIDSRQNYQYKYEQGTIPKGYILNFQSEESILHKIFAYSNRHWICVKLDNTDYYMLDSKKPEPILIQDIDKFLNEMRSNNCEILQVRGRLQNYKQKSILKNKSANPSLLLEDDGNEDFESQDFQQLQNCQNQAQIRQNQVKDCQDEFQSKQVQVKVCGNQVEVCKDQVKNCQNQVKERKNQVKNCQNQVQECGNQVEECKDEIEKEQNETKEKQKPEQNQSIQK